MSRFTVSPANLDIFSKMRRGELHSNERFSLRLDASARCGERSESRGTVEIAVQLLNPTGDQDDRVEQVDRVDRLIVSSDIMDEGGVILAQSPGYQGPRPHTSRLH